MNNKTKSDYISKYNSATDWLWKRVDSVYSYLEKGKDDMLVGFGEDREAFLIGQKDAGRKYGCFDGLTQPLFHHSFWRHVRSNFNSFRETKQKRLTFIVRWKPG